MLALFARKKLIWPAVMTFAGLVLLLSLGVWQIERRAWKEALLAQIAVRTTASPVPLASVLGDVRSGRDVEYMRVRAWGRFLNDRERYFYEPDPTLGPGFNVYVPFELAGDNGVVLVNRGYVPEALKLPAARAAGQEPGEVEITGLLRKPGVKGLFTPDNEPRKNLWYWRDLDGLAASALGPGDGAVVPVFLEVEAPAPGGWPKGGATRLEIPNRHLEYAITWFALAAALAGVFSAFALPRLRS